ncbi:MAG TPA: oxidoreductase [Pseudonocardiaceae bacterium]|nr:oxidoreductase [Pseudonocardiaceae bacterium]
MGLFDAVRRRRRASGVRQPDAKGNAHLVSWAQQHRGVEAYVEPRTTVTETTVVLVAHDGEWTRRRATEQDARDLGKRLGIPVYDANIVGYPQRMRAYTAEMSRRQKQGDGPTRPQI